MHLLALAPSHIVSAASRPTASVVADTSLVAGLRLPRIPGLPDASTPGVPMRKTLGPPSPDSVAGKLDMAIVKGAQRLRTPAGDAWAQRMATDGPVKIWLDFAKQHRQEAGRVQGWLGTALLASSLAATGAATFLAKEHFDRKRPFEVDPSIQPPVARPKSGSYPSGHSSGAFAAARIIAALEPKLADAAYNLARQVAVSRVYAGVHYPSDVVAGALLGTGIADQLLRLRRAEALAAA